MPAATEHGQPAAEEQRAQMPSQDTEEQDRGGSRGQWCFEQPDGTYSPERPKCIDYGQRRLVVVPWPPATTTGTAEASTSVPEGATPPPPPPTSSRDVPAAAEHGQPAAAEHGRTSLQRYMRTFGFGEPLEIRDGKTMLHYLARQSEVAAEGNTVLAAWFELLQVYCLRRPASWLEFAILVEAPRLPVGWTALDILANSYADVAPRMVQQLLEAGAELSPRSRARSTRPLHAALRNGNGEVVDILLAAKADPHARTQLGFSCADLAPTPTLKDLFRNLGVGADESDPDPAPPSRAKPAPPRAPSSYGAQPATPPPPPPLSRRPRLSARGGSSPDVHRRVPPKSKRARSQWPRSPRPSSSEADLEAELEEKPSPKPRPRLSQLDSAKANKSEDTSKAITEVSPKDYEWPPEEDLYEPQEEYFRMLNEDFGIEYSTDKMLPEEYYLSPREEYFRMQDEDLRSRQRLLRGHNTDDTESTLEFGVNPSMQDEDVGAASTSAASKAKPKAASKGAPFTKARLLPKRVQTEAEERQFGAPRKCAQCHAPVKRPLAVNWCPKCKACLHTDCLEAHYVRRHGEPFDHARASSHVQRHATATEEVQTMTIEEELQTIEEHVHTMVALAHQLRERLGGKTKVDKEVQRTAIDQPI